MKQYEAVIQALESQGGQATLAELYSEVMKIKECKWGTKTPFASIRRIVQVRPEIFRVRPGLWALQSYKEQLGLSETRSKKVIEEQNHSFYQGMLVVIGNLRNFSTYIPNQDKNRLFVKKPLGELRSLQEIPNFSHDFLVNRDATIDVTWFNERHMPHSFFEVEFSTDMQNSLLKFFDLQDFYARMVIVSHKARQNEFNRKIEHGAFSAIKDRIKFLEYDAIVKQYEHDMMMANYSFIV